MIHFDHIFILGIVSIGISCWLGVGKRYRACLIALGVVMSLCGIYVHVADRELEAIQERTRAIRELNETFRETNEALRPLLPKEPDIAEDPH